MVFKKPRIPWNKGLVPLKPRECAWCHRLFDKPSSCSMKTWSRTVFCSIRCFRDEANKRKAAERDAIGWTKNCLNCKAEYHRLPRDSNAQWHVRRFCSRKCINVGRKLSEDQRKRLHDSHLGQMVGTFLPGSKHPNWKGGISSIEERIRRMKEYRIWKAAVRFRDRGICRKCGVYGGEFDIDHVKRFRIILQENEVKTLKEAKACEELWDIKNGQVLCLKCHVEKTSQE